jgi:hypothetical protein
VFPLKVDVLPPNAPRFVDPGPQERNEICRRTPLAPVRGFNTGSRAARSVAWMTWSRSLRVMVRVWSRTFDLAAVEVTDPVVAAHVDPSLSSSRLLWPRCGNPSSGTVLVLRGHRDVAGFTQFPHRGNLMPHVGSETVYGCILKLEHLVRAIFCAPGRTRTYDRQIRNRP